MKKYVKLFSAVVLIKFILLVLFSSDYQNKLFIPFIQHFLTNPGNPWQYFYKIQVDKFPYPPLMLYIMSLSYLPCHIFSVSSAILQNAFFKLPTLLSDILITYTLVRMFPNKIKEIIIYYFASPIILYAAYMNSQLDLVPMAILMLSVYLLTSNRPIASAIIFGLALSAKPHLILVLPLILIYMLKNYHKKYIFYFASIPLAVHLLIAAPYILSEGYFWMVLKNPKQMMLFDSFYPIGALKIYIPIFAAIAIYAKFISYRKINNDLFYTFIGVLFAIFVLLVFPAYSWYLWMVPFLSLFFIEYHEKYPNIFYLNTATNILYLIFFIFFFIPEYQDWIFLKMPLNIKVDDERLRNITYTAFQVMLCATVYSMYKFGIRSNSIYKKTHNFIIGIGGDSAAGKTVLKSDIELLLGERVLEMEGDADHKWSRGDENWQVFTHLDPKANYLHKQAQDLFALKYGKSITRSDYDHETGKFASSKRIEPKEFIILSGLHLFYLPIARKIIDLKIYVDTEEKLRRHWKILRDNRERGYSKNKVLEEMERRVGDAKKFVHPQKEFADLIVAYSPKNSFDVGEAPDEPGLLLKVTMDSSIHLEGLVNKLVDENIGVQWDYAEDLKSQYLSLSYAPSKNTIISIAKEIIPNIEEVITQNASWLDGYRGIIQLIVILILSEKMEEESRRGED